MNNHMESPLPRRASDAVRRLRDELEGVIALTRRLADSESSLPSEERPLERQRYLVRLYEATHPRASAGLTAVCDDIVVRRAALPPTSPEIPQLDRLCETCRAVLALADSFYDSVLPAHMREVSELAGSAAALPRRITSGFVMSLEILIKNILKCYCSNGKDVL